MTERALILLSGGLDSATVLAQAVDDGHDCYALSFDYGQRHAGELAAAKRLAAVASVIEHKVLKLGLDQIGGSALTDPDISVPDHQPDGIPVTYVPARNTIFLACALGWAEVLEARKIYIGVNAVDYSGYPDCRAEYIQAFQTMANLATKAGVEGVSTKIETPLIDLSKAEIIQHGLALGVDYSQTVSCYQADKQGRACGHCDACHIRKAGFDEAGVDDPTRYQLTS